MTPLNVCNRKYALRNSWWGTRTFSSRHDRYQWTWWFFISTLYLKGLTLLNHNISNNFLDMFNKSYFLHKYSNAIFEFFIHSNDYNWYACRWINLANIIILNYFSSTQSTKNFAFGKKCVKERESECTVYWRRRLRSILHAQESK